jgi:RNA polymerase sigma-70 factor (ECF subfamily)
LSIVEACPAALHTIRVAAPRVPSDQDLVARMADGDQSALRELMRRNRGRLQRFVTRLLNDRDQIDDVVNDTFMAAWRQAAKFERRASVATWLLAIAKNRALSMRQEHRRREEALDDDYAATLVDHYDTPDMVLEQQGGAKVLRRLIANLPAHQAQLINLVYYHGKSVREVAAIFGIPDNTVKSRMFLTRRRLATLLSAEGINEA